MSQPQTAAHPLGIAIVPVDVERLQAACRMLLERCTARGYGVEVRPGRETFGVYLVMP